jgi:glyoxylase-like metal-dependent hydrolase (beta-lactamase superfamily II)
VTTAEETTLTTGQLIRAALRLLLVAMPMAVLLAEPATAGAPQVRTQAPGFYRMMLGDFEITALSDGSIDLQVKQLLTNTTPEKVEAALERSFLKDPVETSVNGYLINTGTKLVLIDVGAGALFGPTVGRLVANLTASGYAPEQVDAIYITHLHGDHVGGLMNGDKVVFPNATVHCDQRDADHWLSQAKMDAAPQEAKGSFRGAMASIKPYASAGRFKPFDGDTQLTPGIRAAAAHGHTPGHTIYVVESKGQRLVLWGDLMHVAAVQFPEPSVTIRFDTDSSAALVQRQRQFADAAERRSWVAAAHLSFPGIGHLHADGSGYDWVPANYALAR